ncbi:hypothetical protein SAMN04488072_10597 [Lentibacillus halodurans]|uniref:Uncharacterized protein n=1 Tax=Lentibacillus halodurans TaxID=237679 RepID=A0A1I0XJA7_9BACI|nr:hypothetical protein [Lentibacillus halodurans]SFB00777.1 hypothetical protein SAMN04488072_10597 [Lentibacillus halodurans]
MKLRHRPNPLPLQELDAAIPRLSPMFPGFSKLKNDAAIRQQGYTGEIKGDIISITSPACTPFCTMFTFVLTAKNFKLIHSLLQSFHFDC